VLITMISYECRWGLTAFYLRFQVLGFNYHILPVNSFDVGIEVIL